MSDLNKYYKTNKKMWDELAELHSGSDSDYDVENFLKGKNSLKDLELREVGDVKGKLLLHLQCHFGMDTLSWARLGARVTGVDFSEKAISIAKKLARETKIDASFIQSSIYELKDNLTVEKFDIIFTSYGVLCWLHDLQEWGKIISHYLKEGGFFYIAEAHPTGYIFDDEADHLSPRFDYFHNKHPELFVQSGSYATTAETKNTRTYEWTHSMGDIINGLINAGLKIEFLHEFPFICWKMMPFLIQKEDELWTFPDNFKPIVPLCFSLKATKPFFQNLKNLDNSRRTARGLLI